MTRIKALICFRLLLDSSIRKIAFPNILCKPSIMRIKQKDLRVVAHLNIKWLFSFEFVTDFLQVIIEREYWNSLVWIILHHVDNGLFHSERDFYLMKSIVTLLLFFLCFVNMLNIFTGWTCNYLIESYSKRKDVRFE